LEPLNRNILANFNAPLVAKAAPALERVDWGTTPSSNPPLTEIGYSMAGLFALWKSMVYTIDEMEFQAAWDRIKDEYKDQPAILGYLGEHYILWKKEWSTV